MEVKDQFGVKHALKVVKLETSLEVNELVKYPFEERVKVNMEFKEAKVKEALTEVEAWQKLDHPFINKIYDY